MGNLNVPKIKELNGEYLYSSIYRNIFTNINTGQVCYGLSIYVHTAGCRLQTYIIIFSDNEPLFFIDELHEILLNSVEDWLISPYNEGLDKLYNIPGVREDYWKCWTSTIKTNAIIDYIMYNYSADTLDSLYRRVFIRQSDIERRSNEQGLDY